MLLCVKELRLPGYLIFLIVPCTLITSYAFISISYTPLFLYLGIISLLTLGVGYQFIRTHVSVIFTWPVMICAAWCLYILLNGAISGGFHLFHYYLISSCILLFLLTNLFDIQKDLIKVLFLIILLSALIESIICLAQYVGLIKSLNHYFRVTGTWENPNIPAMFLSMSCPAFYGIWHGLQKRLKGFLLFSFSIVLSAIAVLLCRTAIVGVLLQTGIIATYEFNLLQKLKESKKLLFFL